VIQIDACKDLLQCKINKWMTNALVWHLIVLNANTTAAIHKTRRAYLSVLLSRRSARTGRIVVHRSSVMASVFSIRTLAISADTWSWQKPHNYE
jgi:hypothetical protein